MSGSEKPKIDLKSKVHPLLVGLSDYLKNPGNYEAVQKEILNTIVSSCSHGDLLEWAKCRACTERMLERRRLLKRLGFKNPAQYMAWKKVHEQIKKRYPLVDWNSTKTIELHV